jgi:hypothetical protein
VLGADDEARDERRGDDRYDDVRSEPGRHGTSARRAVRR